MLNFSKFSRQKLKEEDFFPQTNDVLIIFDDDNKTSDIKRISSISDGKIFVNAEYMLPLDDCEVTNSATGRNFFCRAPKEYVQETRRLAELEKSIVLSKITQYKPKPVENAMDYTKMALFGVIGLCIIMFGVTSCSNKAEPQQVPVQSYQQSK
ncbi:hypothetical protein OCF66_23870 [Bacillus toyonensis]|uniref:hypothetical protein n=1 Tax=Bacillus toyonensis TaxID=155322 RepID=UPI0021D38B96|nr:hypothetical protein [Bacillus toyonensis]MCU5727978.1 hypothetical protein [Bacillus toyonensis]